VSVVVVQPCLSLLLPELYFHLVCLYVGMKMLLKQSKASHLPHCVLRVKVAAVFLGKSISLLVAAISCDDAVGLGQKYSAYT
jgi:hypothetical protein